MEKTTTAVLMLLASRPSQHNRVLVESQGKGKYLIKWNPSPEHSISQYLVCYQLANGQWNNLLSNETTTSLDNVKPRSTVFIKVLNKAGLEGWDWLK